MLKTYEIDLEDSLVDEAGRLFEALGSDIDSAIKIFLKQAVLRKGFPFEVAIPGEVRSEKLEVRSEEPVAEEEVPCETENIPENDDDYLHGGISEEEESAFAFAAVPVPPVSAEIEARVAANEALVAEMRNEIGEKEVTPEFDENEDDGTHGDYDSCQTENENLKVENEEEPVAEESPSSEESEEEDEDETTPENLFDAWDVGDEEEIGCR